VASGAYRRALLAHDHQLRIVEQACPLFVPLVEEGWFGHPAARLVAEEYLASLRAAGIDALVLGCTHYPLLKPLLGELLGDRVALIDSARETARQLEAILVEQGLTTDRTGEGRHRWAATDDVARFSRIGALFTGRELRDVELVELGPRAVVR
jgi:glutamate racemase